MTMLIAGLLLFLGTHSVRILADGWRTGMVGRLGENAYKGIYSLLSLAGFVMLVYGFGAARLMPTVLWLPPLWTRHLAALLTLPAFVLLVAAYVPGNRFKSRVHHPMILGVKFWALAHLLANGTLAHALLFGSFLAWAVLAFIAARRRDRVAGTGYPAGRLAPTLVTLALGLVAWAGFAMWGHVALIGVRPFGG